MACLTPRNLGEISSTNQLATCWKPRLLGLGWCSKGWEDLAEVPEPRTVRPAGGAGPCPQLHTHSPALRMRGQLRLPPCEPFYPQKLSGQPLVVGGRGGERAPLLGPVPSCPPSWAVISFVQWECAGVTGFSGPVPHIYALMRHPDICYIFQGLGLSPPASRRREGRTQLPSAHCPDPSQYPGALSPLCPTLQSLSVPRVWRGQSGMARRRGSGVGPQDDLPVGMEGQEQRVRVPGLGEASGSVDRKLPCSWRVCVCVCLCVCVLGGLRTLGSVGLGPSGPSPRSPGRARGLW